MHAEFSITSQVKGKGTFMEWVYSPHSMMHVDIVQITLWFKIWLSPLTFSQVHHAVLPAQSSLDFHSEAHFFAD